MPSGWLALGFLLDFWHPLGVYLIDYLLGVIYLDEQEKLLWWYRNLSRQDYYIQGWKKNRIYPDFIFAKYEKKKQTDYSKVLVLEIKGTHLRNDDTDYKSNIFKICNEMGEKLNWGELGLEFSNKKVAFHVIYGNEWQEKMHQMVEI